MKFAISNHLLLAIPFGLQAAIVADPEQLVAFPNDNVFLSPYCWRLDNAGAAICPAGGGYLKFKVIGTSRIVLRVDTAINAAMPALHMPAVKVVVRAPDRDGSAQYFQFPDDKSPNTPITIAIGLNPDVTYSVLIQAVGGEERTPHGWDTPVFQTKINQIVLDAPAKLLPPALRMKRALFLGASYEQAYFGFEKLDAPVYTYVDASLSWPFFVAYALDCEYGQIGIGNQGWMHSGDGDYPAFPFTWDHYDASHPKTYADDLDYVFIHMAENDNAEDNGAIQAAVTAWIFKARTAFGPKTKIFIILSITQIKSAPIRAGVVAAADPNTFLIDPGYEFQHVAFSGGRTWAAPGDGIHLDAVHQGIYTGYVLRHAQAYLDYALHN
jgi:hypothetical protein